MKADLTSCLHFHVNTRKDSFIVLEVDPRQTEKIQLIAQRNGSYVGDVIDVRKDCFGVERFVVLRCK